MEIIYSKTGEIKKLYDVGKLKTKIRQQAPVQALGEQTGGQLAHRL